MREGTTKQQLSRLTEFYDYHELDYYLFTMRMNEVNQTDAIKWLDRETRYRYTAQRIKQKPDIIDYTLEYLIECSGLNINES